MVTVSQFRETFDFSLDFRQPCAIIVESLNTERIMSVRTSDANTKIKRLISVAAIKKYLTDKKKVYSLDLISGWSCPFAKECLSKVHIIDGKRKLKDGPDTQFRCFSASQEVQYTGVYNKRKANYDTLKAADSSDDMATLINKALPENAGVLRWHVGGDFFNQHYFNAAISIAKHNPNVLFYAYTKSLNYWINRFNDIPNNFVLTASRGGRLDNLIDKHSLREAIVTGYETEEQRNEAIASGAINPLPSAESLGLDIDHDDSHAADPSKVHESFALLIHGPQPAGSDAGKAVKKLKGKGSYGK
jgi:hypothetical protein|tara:strand:+ start:365 stop:1273 length:909 start_codon:yes stop_codon:yes gene_type:complete